MNGVIFFTFVISWEDINGQRKRSQLYCRGRRSKKEKYLGFSAQKYHRIFQTTIWMKS